MPEAYLRCFIDMGEIIIGFGPAPCDFVFKWTDDGDGRGPVTVTARPHTTYISQDAVIHMRLLEESPDPDANRVERSYSIPTKNPMCLGDSTLTHYSMSRQHARELWNALRTGVTIPLGLEAIKAETNPPLYVMYIEEHS